MRYFQSDSDVVVPNCRICFHFGSSWGLPGESITVLLKNVSMIAINSIISMSDEYSTSAGLNGKHKRVLDITFKICKSKVISVTNFEPMEPF